MRAYQKPETLWDMLKVKAEPFVEVSELIGQLLGAFVSAPELKPDPAFAKHVTDMLNRMIEQLDAMGLGTTKIAAVRARDHINIPDITIGQCRDYIVQVRDRLPDELAQTCLLSLSPREAALFDPSEPLFGTEVEDAFPSASFDISEAGKCRAIGRWAATVMHLMRALEPAIHSLQRAVGVSVPKEQWDQIINQIESSIRNITKKTHTPDEEQWFSEAATHFRVIKNAWRNYAMHGRDTYDEERASAIYDSVRAFMRHLASRLKD